MKEKGKTNKNKEQTIKCDVETCEHNDGENNCELEEIQVSSENAESYIEAEEKEETVCDSFESKEEDTDDTDEEEDI